MTSGGPGGVGQAQPAHHRNLGEGSAALGEGVAPGGRPLVIVRGGGPCKRRRSRAGALWQSARWRGALVEGVVLGWWRGAGVSRHEVREAALASPSP
jgi:hypothetical protein